MTALEIKQNWIHLNEKDSVVNTQEPIKQIELKDPVVVEQEIV